MGIRVAFLSLLVGSAVSGCGGGSGAGRRPRPPDEPTFVSVFPAGPANENSPTLTGTAPDGVLVRIHYAPECPFADAVEATPEEFAAGIDIAVSNDTVNTFYATSFDLDTGLSSDCVTGPTYVEDSTPPEFGGAVEVETLSDSEITVRWDAASDAVTPSGLLVYELCMAEIGTECLTDFIPDALAGVGETEWTFDGLAENVRHWFVVRVRDQAGNLDDNSSEPTAKTMGRRSVESIALGGSLVCAVLADGTARCVGANDSGQLGAGLVSAKSPVPVLVQAPVRLTQIDGGAEHACGLAANGSVWCWGLNSAGQLGNGTVVASNVPVQVSGITSAKAVATGDEHSCAVLASGGVRCWGKNFWGQLGDGTGTASPIPVVVTGVANAKAISLGGTSSCALLAAGTVRCWGDNFFGQLGVAAPSFSLTSVAVTGLSSAVELGAGSEHACTALADGTARCWGRGTEGQLGNGLGTNSSNPVTVSALTGVTSISGGFRFTCARMATGLATCWGVNNVGQLGNGSTSPSLTPTAVPINGVAALEVDTFNACALAAHGTVRCWGVNESGQLSDGTETTATLPVPAGGLVGFVAATHLSMGARSTSRLADGTYKTWGAGDLLPVALGEDLEAGLLLEEWGNTCVATSNGQMLCWGSNNKGAVGDGTNIDRVDPVAPLSLGSVRDLATHFHTCAIGGDGTGRCWGYNFNGQVGDGSAADRNAPVAVTGISGLVDIDVGSDHTCAVLAGGSVRCWGSDQSGQLGTGSFIIESRTPATVTGISSAIAIGLGNAHSCALLADGTVRCWGLNFAGELGDGSGVDSPTPLAVAGIADAVEISIANYFGCARLASGGVRCWGLGIYGNLGDGNFDVATTPVAVVGVAGAKRLAAGSGHTCVLTSSGGAACFGDNFDGNLGDGTQQSRALVAPVAGFP